MISKAAHRRWTPLKLVAVAVLAVAIGAAAVATSLYLDLDEAANTPRENIQWAAYQVQAEHLKLMLAAHEAELGQIDLDDLAERYEIFVSRLLVLRDGGSYAAMRLIPDFGVTLSRALAAVPVIDGELAGGGLDATAYAATLTRHLEGMGVEFQQIALQSVGAASQDQTARQLEVRNTVSYLAITLVLIVAVSIGLAAVAMKQFAAIETARRDLAAALWRAEASNRAKSTFLAGMSHEMRTPLNAVIGMLREIGYRTPDPGIRKLSETAHASADMLCGLVDDVLDTTRIETGKFQFQFTAFDPAALVEEVTSVLSSRAEDRNDRIVTDTEGLTGRFVVCDRARLKQVLVNLVGNAIKYTGDGTITLRATLAPGSDDTVRLRVSVTDTGIGIAPHLHDKIFGRFFQAGSNDGLGLGLTIAREIVERLGGTIGVDSALRRGSTFWFDVPVTLTAEPAVPLSAPRLFDRLDGVRLLVAEDNATNRQVVRLLLERHGAEFAFASNGEQAVAMALSSRYDAVLMDINMPVKDGLQALAEIRRKAGPSAPPVIALTADALADDRERFLAAGMIACVTKPIDEADLLQTLDRVLGRPGYVADRAGATGPARDAGRSTLTEGQRRAVLDLVSALDDEPEADA
ncbi:hypothetical protein GCM10017083_29270 [Thalassobaculum fulvum]|uniref:histidine kinase n=1 Tax=Thalassobaculum fulvum TaxID=1633335 RepID=A0A919CQ41_9PROT|nr:ATP-binding protein [Thalassobaculum fulvum]GHD53057.1 hypothetical protein GCM10017083_29270 [Thalassobaculum fulvum]